jgi:hypothetical protein
LAVNETYITAQHGRRTLSLDIHSPETAFARYLTSEISKHKVRFVISDAQIPRVW